VLNMSIQSTDNHCNPTEQSLPDGSAR